MRSSLRRRRSVIKNNGYETGNGHGEAKSPRTDAHPGGGRHTLSAPDSLIGLQPPGRHHHQYSQYQYRPVEFWCVVKGWGRFHRARGRETHARQRRTRPLWHQNRPSLPFSSCSLCLLDISGHKKTRSIQRWGGFESMKGCLGGQESVLWIETRESDKVRCYSFRSRKRP